MKRQFRLSQIIDIRYLSIGALLLIAAITIPVASNAIFAEGSSSREITSFQRQLRGEVDTIDGSPRSGRDPADQLQTSLADAAAQPIGNGLRVDKPAAKVVGDNKPKHKPLDAYSNLRASTLLTTGCIYNYLSPGKKCASTLPGANQSADCAFDVSLDCVLASLRNILFLNQNSPMKK